MKNWEKVSKLSEIAKVVKNGESYQKLYLTELLISEFHNKYKYTLPGHIRILHVSLSVIQKFDSVGQAGLTPDPQQQQWRITLLDAP